MLAVGHNVPDSLVRPRLHSGWRDSETIFRHLVDEWAVYDNSGSSPILLEEGRMTQRQDTASKQSPTSDSEEALAALRIAAVVARRRAFETCGYVTVFRDGKIVRDTTVAPRPHIGRWLRGIT